MSGFAPSVKWTFIFGLGCAIATASLIVGIKRSTTNEDALLCGMLFEGCLIWGTFWSVICLLLSEIIRFREGSRDWRVRSAPLILALTYALAWIGLVFEFWRLV